MLWSELLAALDAARSQIRGARKMKDEVLDNDPILEDLFNAMAGTAPNLKLVIDPDVLETPTLDALREPPTREPIIIEAVDRGAREGRMLVFARDTPHVVRKPVLEEVFDEKDLG